MIFPCSLRKCISTLRIKDSFNIVYRNGKNVTFINIDNVNRIKKIMNDNVSDIKVVDGEVYIIMA